MELEWITWGLACSVSLCAKATPHHWLNFDLSLTTAAFRQPLSHPTKWHPQQPEARSRRRSGPRARVRDRRNSVPTFSQSKARPLARAQSTTHLYTVRTQRTGFYNMKNGLTMPQSRTRPSTLSSSTRTSPTSSTRMSSRTA